MKEPHKKGVANHLGPKSCAEGRETLGEALTGVHAGQVFSSEITKSGVPTLSSHGEGNTKGSVQRELPFDTAESETLSMRENSMRENREVPETPTPDGGVGRSGKVDDREPDMHVSGKSDKLVVPTKRANKAGQQAVEEPVEGRRLTKGNVLAVGRVPDTEPEGRVDRLEGVRQAARRDRKARFTALLHHISPELLQASFFELRRQAAPGVDGVTCDEYAQGLYERIADLHRRVHSGTYRALPSKRAWISKADGRMRPLGIAALEDKIVQQAVKTVLEAIFEEEFLGFSYGFRPGRNQHNALDALWVGITQRKVNWVLDADIRGYFDQSC